MFCFNSVKYMYRTCTWDHSLSFAHRIQFYLGRANHIQLAIIRFDWWGCYTPYWRRLRSFAILCPFPFCRPRNRHITFLLDMRFYIFFITFLTCNRILFCWDAPRKVSNPTRCPFRSHLRKLFGQSFRLKSKVFFHLLLFFLKAFLKQLRFLL